MESGLFKALSRVYFSSRKICFHFGTFQGMNLAFIVFFIPEKTNFAVAFGNFLNAGSSCNAAKNFFTSTSF
jgi:hypothetical protein